MSLSKNVCLIPAKGASTRLKKKNIQSINGKEMIYYSINAAINSKLFEEKDVIVSTESDDVAEIAKKHGANIPYKRDEKLAHDPYGCKDVALDFLEKNPDYKEYDNLFIVMPTAPMILSEDFTRAFDVFQKKGHKYLMTVSETDQNAQRTFFVKDGFMEPLFPDKILKRTQELEPTYSPNGAVIIVNIADFLESKTYFKFPIGVYVMPRERSIDVDTEIDFKIARVLMGDY